MRLCVAVTPGHQPPGGPSACQPATETKLLNFSPTTSLLISPHLSDDEAGQSHPSDGADQLHGGAVVDVAVPHRELLGFVLIVIN